ncbi:MAG: hypothetical protein K0R98_1618 [Rickettsiaceae bacterium]|jgi:hypothetical protein|nr:hypothetical protein [Gammaproteobacteria bacterium]MCE3233361.1 hypothetical protein [Rickettsiaceae bacterium]
MIIEFLIIFVLVVSGGLILHTLKKAADICKQVKATEPDFLKQRARYNLMTRIDDTQFILFIISGDYKRLKSISVVKACTNIRRTFFIASIVFILLILSLTVFFHFMTIALASSTTT